jgi:hypothetical protein
MRRVFCEILGFHRNCNKACSIAECALVGNAKTQEKQLVRENIAMSWYTHHYALVGALCF